MFIIKNIKNRTLSYTGLRKNDRRENDRKEIGDDTLRYISSPFKDS